MTEDVYIRLREHLDNMPGGFPSTESGVEIKILKKFFTPEEAKIAANLKPVPEPVSAIAERIGMEEAEAADKLESMAKQGSIYRIRAKDKVLYMALQFVVGIYEFHLNSIDRELAELLEEYMPYIGLNWISTNTKQLRVIPVESSLDAKPAIGSYNNVHELIKDQEMIAVAPCICRKEKALMGKPCDKPLETCFTFGHAAAYYVENGMGRMISYEEAVEILRQAEEAGLVLCPTNAKDIVNICCCCGCCCGILRNIKMLPRPADHFVTFFRAEIDSDMCTACGICLDRCQMDAITENEDSMEIDSARCIGCGLCVSTCDAQAITMIEIPEVQELPANVVDMQMRISKERKENKNQEV